MAWANGSVEIFIELISFLFVLVEEKSLEDDGWDEEESAYEGYESHILKLYFKRGKLT